MRIEDSEAAFFSASASSCFIFCERVTMDEK